MKDLSREPRGSRPGLDNRADPRVRLRTVVLDDLSDRAHDAPDIVQCELRAERKGEYALADKLGARQHTRSISVLLSVKRVEMEGAKVHTDPDILGDQRRHDAVSVGTEALGAYHNRVEVPGAAVLRAVPRKDKLA